MNGIVVIAVLGVGGFILWKNWDKIAGSVGQRTTSPGDDYFPPPVVPQVANGETKGGFKGACNTVYGQGSQAAMSSGNPKAQAAGAAMQYTGPLMCNYVYPAVGKVYQSAGKAVVTAGKGVGKTVASGAKKVWNKIF